MNTDQYMVLREAVLADLEGQGLSSADLRAALVEEMEASPEWKVLYRRVYQGVSGYGSAKRAAETYYTAIQWLKNALATAPAAIRAVYCAACQAKENDFPIFFVNAQLLSAVLNTSLPAGIRWSEMKLPFEAGVFCLPRGTLRYVDGTEVNHLGWLRARKGDLFRFGSLEAAVSVPYDAFTVYAQPLNEDGTILYSSLDENERPYIDDGIIEESWRGTFDLPLTAGDDEFLRLCRSLTFGLLMVMVSRPSLVSYGGRERKQSKKSEREFWAPNIIGRDYKAQREHQGGTHASPRGGWRRGHYTHQLIGSIKNNPDFISAASLPRLQDGRIDWASIDDETRAKFWLHHEHRWLEPIWIDGEAE
jgi:hypothetical protein